MRQAPRSPLSFKLQRVANVPERPPPSTRLMSCAHIANRRLSRIIGARAFPNPRIDLGSFPFRVRKMVLLLVRARLGARNLAAARPTENSHRRRCGEQPFASCLLRGIFIFTRPLVATDSPLHRAHTVRFVLDGGNRRLLGGT